MKRLFSTTLFCAVSLLAFAQVAPDSVSFIYSKTSMDTLQQKVIDVPDIVLPSFHKIDSIRNEFNLAIDSIQTQYQETVSKIEAQTNKFKQSIDSLVDLNLPATKFTKRLDSLNQIRQSIENKFTSKLDALKSKTIDKVKAIDLPPEYREPLQKLTKNVDALNLNSGMIKIPALDLPGYSLPDIDGIGDLTTKAGKIGNIGSPSAPQIETPVGDLGNITAQAEAYKEDIKKLTQGNLDDIQKLPETIEKQASKIEGIDELKKQSGVIDEHNAKLDDFKDPNSAKEKVVEVAQKAAVDHFAGKQEQIKAAVDKVSKYKQKYSSVSSIKDLPKRPPNPMKGKPFIERLVPGLYFQYQQKNLYLIDVNPYVGYKVGGRFSAGLGWNHRYAYERKTHTWNKRSIIFGPRGYVDFKLGKGFIAHVEGERMNTFVTSTLIGNPDTGHREWVWSFMTGLKKEYRIYKNLKGTA